MKIAEALEIVIEREGNSKQSFLASLLKVSQGTISNYLSKDPVPEPKVAGILYGKYDLVVYPYVEKFVKAQWDYAQKYHT